MHHFFTTEDHIADGYISIDGDAYNHAVNVLRLKKGERIIISDEQGTDYQCVVSDIAEDEQTFSAKIEDVSRENHELPARVILFQALPKSDKMELIIQKATELGVTAIVPVETRNCVVKLDGKRADQKVKRWQAIAQSAAEQSKRSKVPEICPIISFTEAVKAAEVCDVKIIPYENAEGLTTLSEAIISFLPDRSIAIFIGPEGGFDRLEIKHAENHGIVPVSLGKRILRVETAAIAILSLVMIRLEIAEEMNFGPDEE